VNKKRLENSLKKGCDNRGIKRKRRLLQVKARVIAKNLEIMMI
jgi:hypothetical protein